MSKPSKTQLNFRKSMKKLKNKKKLSANDGSRSYTVQYRERSSNELIPEYRGPFATFVFLVLRLIKLFFIAIVIFIILFIIGIYIYFHYFLDPETLPYIIHPFIEFLSQLSIDTIIQWVKGVIFS